ncbi:hypothetical protein P171DRAFT_16315 [Karstenula rhodostoma CBS 690.94]|uniref:Uncharacterized protein n=1 Tax=Karstenula rhodostoma CBS 690.94 TaxID=1392251 RepID=A0A9P4UJS7_9PLEO|nr:hypothetical protein P171DRAFT_16315 [Karstenula rhodostoma CBS 690.94]
MQRCLSRSLEITVLGRGSCESHRLESVIKPCEERLCGQTRLCEARQSWITCTRQIRLLTLYSRERVSESKVTVANSSCMSILFLAMYGRLAQKAEAKNGDLVVHARWPVSLQLETRKKGE